jgi:coenzyme F420 hydrogenase subunit beta
MIDKDLKIYDDVCTGCSACTEACHFPDENGIYPIMLIKNNKGLNVPIIDANICTKCMACYKACPTEDKLFNRELSYELYKNQIGSCFYGYSLDEDHRFKAATAGITTEIAAVLLDMGRVDGVVSSYQNDSNEIITEIFTDSKKVRKTRGSIYRQVSLLNGLAKKIEKGKYKKLLVIGLSCHIEGLKTLHKTNKYLKKNVEFITIALFCKQTKTEKFSDVIRDVLKANKNEKIEYRGDGWPGFMKISEDKKLKVGTRKIGRLWPSFAFAPSYCLTCSDPLGLVADISIGDAWIDKYADDTIGSSLFVANTSLGIEIINILKDSKKIYIEKETKENILNSQNPLYTYIKTSYLDARISFFTDFKSKNLNKIPKNYINTLRLIKINKILQESSFMKNMPNSLIRIYNRLYSIALKLFS